MSYDLLLKATNKLASGKMESVLAEARRLADKLEAELHFHTPGPWQYRQTVLSYALHYDPWTQLSEPRVEALKDLLHLAELNGLIVDDPQRGEDITSDDALRLPRSNEE